MEQRYEIRLKGHLDVDWSARLNDFTITNQAEGITILKGSVVDQAALHGLFAQIRNLNLPILLVNCLETEHRRKK